MFFMKLRLSVSGSAMFLQAGANGRMTIAHVVDSMAVKL